ncbi:MAG TPA: hypothetical protein VFX09_07800 [Burkholderiales bacterium]|nr:hypothetical protein [Burkholderiales bacterium]
MLIIRLIVYLLAAMLAGAPAAARAVPELRAGLGADVLLKGGMAMGSLSAGPFSALAWDNHNYGLGLSYRFGDPVGWNAGVGGILVRHLDEDVGTRLNLLLRGSYCGRRLCFSYAHISHGAGLGIEPRKANSGLNFLFLEFRFGNP